MIGSILSALPHVLVVDDEIFLHEELREELEAAGYVVSLASNGAQAIRRLESDGQGIAALLTDVRMGSGPSGWDVARRARELFPHMPTIYMTGESPHDWAAYGVPQSLMLSKPFAMAQMITAVSQLLNQPSPP